MRIRNNHGRSKRVKGRRGGRGAWFGEIASGISYVFTNLSVKPSRKGESTGGKWHNCFKMVWCQMLVLAKAASEAQEKSDPASGSICSHNVFMGEGNRWKFPLGWHLLNLKVKITSFSCIGVHGFRSCLSGWLYRRSRNDKWARSGPRPEESSRDFGFCHM